MNLACSAAPGHGRVKRCGAERSEIVNQSIRCRRVLLFIYALAEKRRVKDYKALSGQPAIYPA